MIDYNMKIGIAEVITITYINNKIIFKKNRGLK